MLPRTTSAASAADMESSAQALDDGKTVDALVEAFYESMSFLPGDKPDWERFLGLFAKGAVIVANGDVMDVPAFVERSKESIKELKADSGFLEVEVARRVEMFCGIAHAFSTYEARFSPYDVDPIHSGVTSLQLANLLGRWCILSMTSEIATEANPLPSRYRKK
eukprot:TRINITY_DN18782_c0_g1_i1.p1 TRINITY_DN18782_c0_g1~~TRINITY_DN18782_c0_g1_i1.p1  ORF type:complete len:180 (+),score=46.66 TRINITY_DN18782_c0_g1_i1:51-542(+)